MNQQGGDVVGEVDAFDRLVASIDYPVFVVTTGSRDGRSGCLVGFATQISIDPRRFLVGISRSNHTFTVAASADHLAVHLISREHRELATLFGGTTGDAVDKFAHCRWTHGPYGLPVLTDAAMWFAGRVVDRLDLGDHTGYLLEPDGGGVATDTADPAAWVSFADTHDIDPGHSA
ncbi:flavin reductase family protein [Gordonia sp. DT30]|uniref:flavin reductase family protein n=1 Tax=unclassified Gordonia (in: high G+C Gram-positive bacteria) TaxID=2657482 RepID=UPI003CE7B3EC